MSIESKVSVEKVLLHLIKHECWDLYNKQVPIKYVRFKTLLTVGDNKLTAQDRICRRRWLDLEELGIGKKMNGSNTYMINLERVVDFLEEYCPNDLQFLDIPEKVRT